MPIVNPAETILGRLADMAIDRYSGRVAYAVVTSEVVPHRRVAVPWSSLAPDLTQRCLLLDMDAKRFAQTPALPDGPLPDTPPTFETPGPMRYGTDPVWDVAGS
jgi:hypothetical protein